MLYLALEQAFNSSSTESRQITEEYSAILASTEFATAFQVFQACVDKDFASISSHHMAFRGNAFGNRAAMEILRTYGKEYSLALATPIFEFARKWSDAEAQTYELCEYKIDEAQLGGRPIEQYIEEAQIKFRNLCEFVLDTVVNTPVPEHIRYLLKWAQEQADSKIADGKFDTISGLLTLRFIVPALVSSPLLTPAQTRPILRASQALQALTIGVTLSNKEQYMSFLDAFFTSNASRYEDWRQTVLSTESKSLEELKPKVPTFAPPSSCPRLVEFVASTPDLLTAVNELNAR